MVEKGPGLRNLHRFMSIDTIRAAQPRTGIILGSGLGEVAQALGIACEVPYADVPGLQASTVPGHVGRLVLAEPAGRPVLIAQGRSHLYEGLTAQQVTAQVRLMHELGVRTLLITNAAGCINTGFTPGELMLITDHLNLTGTSPLIGGPHFHDMTEAYSEALRSQLLQAAAAQGIRLHAGVYAGLIGPQYETPAEIRMLRVLGADAVGMSTVLEVIQARALGMEVAGLSSLTNWAAGITPEQISHADVMSCGRGLTRQIGSLVQALVSGS